MIYVVCFLVVYSAIFGWVANKKIAGGKLTRQNKDSLYLVHMLIFYMASIFESWLGNTKGVVVFFIIASIFNLISIEIYWHRYKEYISKIRGSFWLNILALLLLSAITSGSVLLSGMLIEEITLVPSSAINNVVIVYSILMIVSILLISSVFAIEIGAFILFFYYIFRLMKGYSNNADAIYTAVLLPMPILIMFSIYTSYLFDSNWIKKGLFYVYHSNEYSRCNNIDKNSKFLPISGTEVSVVKFDKEKDIYKFSIGLCKKKEEKKAILSIE